MYTGIPCFLVLHRYSVLYKLKICSIKTYFVAKKKAISLEYYINFVDKAVEGFDRIDCNFERTSNVGKMLSNSIACCREILLKRKSPLMRQNSLLSYFKEWPQPSQLSSPNTLISQQPSTLRQDPPPAKILHLTKGSDDG